MMQDKPVLLMKKVINLFFREHLGYIGKHANPVIGKYLDFRGILLVVGSAFGHLPLRVNEPAPLILRQVNHVDAVRAVDGYASAPGDKSHDFIARNRVTAM